MSICCPPQPLPLTSLVLTAVALMLGLVATSTSSWWQVQSSPTSSSGYTHVSIQKFGLWIHCTGIDESTDGSTTVLKVSCAPNSYMSPRVRDAFGAAKACVILTLISQAALIIAMTVAIARSRARKAQCIVSICASSLSSLFGLAALGVIASSASDIYMREEGNNSQSSWGYSFVLEICSVVGSVIVLVISCVDFRHVGLLREKSSSRNRPGSGKRLVEIKLSGQDKVTEL